MRSINSLTRQKPQKPNQALVDGFKAQGVPFETDGAGCTIIKVGHVSIWFNRDGLVDSMVEQDSVNEEAA